MALSPERAAFRLELSRHETPRALWWTAGVILVLSILNPLINPEGFTPTDLLHAAVVALFALGAYATGRPWMPPAVSPWVLGVCAVVVVCSFEFEVWIDATALGVVYVLLAMQAFGPFTLSPKVMAVASVPMMVGFVIAAREWAPDDLARWVAAAAAALLIGAVVLRIRLQGIDALGDLTEEHRDLATLDSLTGALNRRGVEDRVPSMIAMAARRQEPVFVAFVDVDGLKNANDRFGHEFGDEVIVTVANAVRAMMRATDVVGRWGGDEFIVVGLGNPLPPDQFEARLRERIQESAIDLDRWPGEVSIGVATADADGLVFTELVRAADVHMYSRRRSRRSD